MQKRLFLHIGAAGLGSTLAGCLATPSPVTNNGPLNTTEGASASTALVTGTATASQEWDSLRTPPSGLPSAHARQAAQRAFERAHSGQMVGAAAYELPAQSTRRLAAAHETMDKAMADFVRRWPSIAPRRRTAAMARSVTPSIAQTLRQIFMVVDQQTRNLPTTPSRPAAPVARTSADLVLPPGTSASFAIKGYCLDAVLPAPVKGDLAFIVPVADHVIPPALSPLYAGAATWATHSPQNAALAQQVYWALAHAGTNSPWARTPAPAVRKAFDEITPSGASIYNSYHSSEFAKRELLRNLLKQTGLDRYIGADQIARGDYAGAAQRVLEQQIAQGSRMPSQKGLGYSWLAPGVAARTTGYEPLGLSIEVLNTSDQPFRFIPANFIAKSPDKKQPVALPGKLTGINITSFLGGPKAALDQLFTNLDTKLINFFSNPVFAGAFDWMSTSPRFSMSVDKAVARIKDLDSRYPVKAALGSTPVVGSALSLYEGVTGRDWLYDDKLSATEQAIALASIMPGQAAILNSLKVLERSGALKALERIPGLEQFARNLPAKIEEAVESVAFKAGWMPVRGAMRSARNDINANGDGGIAVLDESVNVFQLLPSANLGLPTAVTSLLSQQSPNWASLMGLR